ncbi:hypothetical protein UZ36_07860 [Candidatus Nitromaritima sp. SCGC AAA799-C22]|nr:hypothetical protein UZ36_07860 [Candidatus Nitromaritima sp. SCGC AAA799-C22]
MKTHRPERNQKGIALMVVLWALVLLLALATEFAFSMKAEVNTTRNFKEDVESYHLAKAGIHLAMAEVLMPATFHASDPDLGLISGIPPVPATGTPEPEEEEGEKKTYRSFERQEIPIGKGSVTYTIEDENSKVPINKTTRDTLVKILTIAGVEVGAKRDTIADSILDWIDADDDHRLNGAENDYYKNRSPSYLAKNGPIENLDELLKIRGIDEDLLYGSDEPGGLNRFFTVYDIKTINPNTASEEVITAMFNESQAKLIVSTREEKGFYNNTTSDYFRIRSTGNIEGSPAQHSITAVVQKLTGKDGPTLFIHYWNDNSFEQRI